MKRLRLQGERPINRRLENRFFIGVSQSHDRDTRICRRASLGILSYYLILSDITSYFFIPTRAYGNDENMQEASNALSDADVASAV